MKATSKMAGRNRSLVPGNMSRDDLCRRNFASAIDALLLHTCHRLTPTASYRAFCWLLVVIAILKNYQHLCDGQTSNIITAYNGEKTRKFMKIKIKPGRS